jgi:hypothetical protein
MRIAALRLSNLLMSAFLVATVGVVIVWSLLLNATDVVAGLLDHTGATRRSH